MLVNYELKEDLNGLIQIAKELTYDQSIDSKHSLKNNKFISFDSDTYAFRQTNNYNNNINNMSIITVNNDKIKELELKIENLHNKLIQQSESYNAQTTRQQKQINKLKTTLESKDQSMKHLQASSKQIS